MGLHRAGYEVVGVDAAVNVKTKAPGCPSRIKALTKYYPFDLIIGDALNPPVRLEDFDLIWASPPCQRYTMVFRGREKLQERYPDLLPPTRALLEGSGVPYIIENVPGAPIRADVVLSGAMFGLDIVRRRHFECSGFTPPFALQQQHYKKTVSDGTLSTVAGAGANNAWNVRRKAEKRLGKATKWRNLPEELKNRLREKNTAAAWREAMGIDWMTRDELREAVPPAYAEFIARAAIEAL